jgi:hypothetical protein
VRCLLVTANVNPSSPILATLMMEALCSTETLVLTSATWHNVPEDGILNLYIIQPTADQPTNPLTEKHSEQVDEVLKLRICIQEDLGVNFNWNDGYLEKAFIYFLVRYLDTLFQIP